jgi:hypothetical protein
MAQSFTELRERPKWRTLQGGAALLAKREVAQVSRLGRRTPGRSHADRPVGAGFPTAISIR